MQENLGAARNESNQGRLEGSDLPNIDFFCNLFSPPGIVLFTHGAARLITADDGIPLPHAPRLHQAIGHVGIRLGKSFRRSC
jgi:hypothetical protein